MAKAEVDGLAGAPGKPQPACAQRCISVRTGTPLPRGQAAAALASLTGHPGASRPWPPQRPEPDDLRAAARFTERVASRSESALYG